MAVITSFLANISLKVTVFFLRFNASEINKRKIWSALRWVQHCCIKYIMLCLMRCRKKVDMVRVSSCQNLLNLTRLSCAFLLFRFPIPLNDIFKHHWGRESFVENLPLRTVYQSYIRGIKKVTLITSKLSNKKSHKMISVYWTESKLNV